MCSKRSSAEMLNTGCGLAILTSTRKHVAGGWAIACTPDLVGCFRSGRWGRHHCDRALAGGVLPTVGLFALTSLSPSQVAGTPIITHVATGGLATAAYTRSGQLHGRQTRRLALILASAAVVGTPAGVAINTLVSDPKPAVSTTPG